jgi:hypothetical protein
MLEFARKEQRLLQVLVTFKTEFTGKDSVASLKAMVRLSHQTGWNHTPQKVNTERNNKKQKGRHIWKKKQIYGR